MTAAPTQIDSVILDLGGVVLPLLDGALQAALARLFSVSSQELLEHPGLLAFFDAFERGEMSRGAFRCGVAERLAPNASPPDNEFDAAWASNLPPLPESSLETLRRLGKRRRVFLLSNTNALHLDRFFADLRRHHGVSENDWQALFEHDYYSHHLGLRKPDASIFEHVLSTHNLDRDRTLFVDDHPPNIEGAERIGLPALLHPHNEPLHRSLAPLLD